MTQARLRTELFDTPHCPSSGGRIALDRSCGISWDMAEKFGKVIRRPGRENRWCVDVRPFGRIYSYKGVSFDGQQVEGKTGKERAELVLYLIRQSLTSGYSKAAAVSDFLPLDNQHNLVTTRLPRWLDVKRREVESGDRSPTYLRKLLAYAKPEGHFSFWDDVLLHEINYGLIEDWSHWLADRKLSPKTRKNIMGAFHSFLTWLKRRGELAGIPDFAWPTVPEYEPTILSPRTQAAVLGAIPEEERGIFLAMGLLGVRPGEARAFETHDISFDDDGIAWLEVSKAMKGYQINAPIRGTKTGKTAVLPCPIELQKWIERWVPREQRLEGVALFLNPRTGDRWTPSAIRTTWHKACDAAGCPRVSPYEGLKHSCATKLLNDGTPLDVVQKLLRHKDARSTQKYAKRLDQGLLDAVRPRDLSPACLPEKMRSKNPIIIDLNGTGRGNRTPMGLHPGDFESPASTNSAIPAQKGKGE